MIRLAALFGLLGLAAATALIISSGYAQILEALRQAGFGIVITTLFHIVPMLFCVFGWQALMPGKKRPSIPFFLYILWLRSSVNNLMPVARIGGEVVAVRVMMKHGIRQTAAVASTVVELTLSVVGMFLFNVTGIAMFVLHVGDEAPGWKLAAALLFALPILCFLGFVQRVGFFGLLDKIFAAMFRERWTKFAGSAARLDRAVHAMYRRKKRVLICGFWQIVSWTSGAGEIWLALYYLGHAVPIAEAVMIEALIQATASVAFAVPGALGVQEAGFLLFGKMLGLTPDIALALAVIRRCRDLLLFVPGLLLWQIQEGRWLLRSKKP